MVKNLPSKPNKLNKQSWHLTCLFRGVSCDKLLMIPVRKQLIVRCKGYKGMKKPRDKEPILSWDKQVKTIFGEQHCSDHL